MDIGQLVVAIGPWAIALGAGFEGETAAVAGGVMAHRALFPVWAAFGATALGAFFADQMFFQIGRRFRDRPFVTHARQKPAFARAVGLIERWPIGFILAYRFIYGFRMVSPVAIGLSSLRWRRFAALNVVACVIWSAIFTTIGYLFGPTVDRVLTALRPHHAEILVALPVPGLCLLGWWLWRRRNRIRRERLAEPFHPPGIAEG